MAIATINTVMDLDEVKSRAKEFSINRILKENAYQNIPLSFETAYMLGIFTLYPYKEELSGLFSIDKDVADKQSLAALCSLHNSALYSRDKAEDQIAGICAAIFDFDIRLSKDNFLLPDISFAIDNCGMGGDLLRTPNVSTISALIAAAQGILMCKHGSPGNTDSVGSSDFLQYMGVDLFPSKKLVEQALERVGFGYTDALDTNYKHIHVQTHRSAHLAHMNDIIGPITNPLHPALMKKRIVGINHLIPPDVVAKAYRILNDKGVTSVAQGLFVRGFGDKERNKGMDELSLLEGGTMVAELDSGDIRTYSLYASDFGVREGRYANIDPGEDKARYSCELLQGRGSDDAINLVCANAALLSYVMDRTPLAEGFSRARETLISAAAFAKLHEYKDCLDGGAL